MTPQNSSFCPHLTYSHPFPQIIKTHLVWLHILVVNAPSQFLVGRRRRKSATLCSSMDISPIEFSWEAFLIMKLFVSRLPSSSPGSLWLVMSLCKWSTLVVLEWWSYKYHPESWSGLLISIACGRPGPTGEPGEGLACIRPEPYKSVLADHKHLRDLFNNAVKGHIPFSSVQFSSVAQSCPTLCDPMNSGTPGLPVHHQLPKFTQTHVHRVNDAIQPSHSLSLYFAAFLSIFESIPTFA